MRWAEFSPVNVARVCGTEFMKITPQDGDCWALCISHLFEVPFAEVAHLSCARSPDGWFELTEAWLAERGLFSLQIKVSADRQWPFHQLPDKILAIAVGISASGEGHCCLVKLHCDSISIQLEPIYQPFGAISEVTGLVFFPKLFLKTSSCPLQAQVLD